MLCSLNLLFDTVKAVKAVGFVVAAFLYVFNMVWQQLLWIRALSGS